MLIIESIIKNRLKLIQKRNNFNPNLGIGQIKNCPENLFNIKYKDFIIFKEYISLINKLNIDIEIPRYSKITTKSVSNVGYVYFGNIYKSNIWKIGHSINPYKRGQKIQTDNAEEFFIRYQVLGSMKLESLIKKYTEKRKTSADNEWRAFDKSEVMYIVSLLKKHELNFINYFEKMENYNYGK